MFQLRLEDWHSSIGSGFVGTTLCSSGCGLAEQRLAYLLIFYAVGDDAQGVPRRAYLHTTSRRVSSTLAIGKHCVVLGVMRDKVH